MEKLFDALVFFGLFQGLFLLIILLYGSRYRKRISVYLILLIVVLVTGLLGRTLLLLEIFGKEPRLITISEFSMMLFGPSFALFIRSSLHHKPINRRDIIHYLPAFVHIIYLIFYFILASDDLIEGRLASGELIRIVLAIGAIGLLVNYGYWIWSWRLFFQLKMRVKQELSHAVKSKFLFFFLIAIGICLTMWLVIFLVTIFNYELMTRLIYSFVWISLTWVVLFLGFYSFTQPEIFNLQILETKKYAKSKLSVSDIQRLKEELEGIMVQQRPYLNKRLLKTELSDLIDLSGPEMARLLNEGFGVSFFEFVNYYRIKEFIRLVESQRAKTLTFAGIAEEAGFNSKATFNKSFKDIMGKTPREYFAKKHA